MDDISDVIILIRKKMAGTISDQELLFLEKWVAESPLHAELLKRAEDEEIVLEDIRDWLALRNGERNGVWDERLKSKTLYKIHADSKKSQIYRMSIFRQFLPYVAVLLTILTFIFIYYRSHVLTEHYVEIHDLAPGTNKALITLSDGSVIELSDDQDGVVLGEELTYEDGTSIIRLSEEEVVYSTIQTPRGGQYQITLADGTKVWLNAETKLTYPSHFTGGLRMVELEGEAYFEVKPFTTQDHRIPFLVKTAQQEIEVLGTQFNIKAYADEEGDTRTTLVEGAVLLHAAGNVLPLMPGEQGLNDGRALSKKKVDVSSYIAWKDNRFMFEELELREALKILSRWYDFDFQIDQTVKHTYLYASISRGKSLKEVLRIIESSGIKFRLERLGERNKLTIFN